MTETPHHQTPETNAADAVLDRIFRGDLSAKAQGFLVAAPDGHRLESRITAHTGAAYGGQAHPDLRVIAPEGRGGLITVDAIRGLQPFLTATPSAGAMKTLVVLDAHRLNAAAANAFLKPLEEPTGHTRIVLVTDAPADLPVTIRSRCTHLQTPGDRMLAAAEMRDRLDAASGHDPSAHPASARPSLGLSDTAIAEALDLTDDNPETAATLHRLDLAAWVTEAAAFVLEDAAATPPLPKLTGKDAVPLADAISILQSYFVGAARTAQTPDACRNAAWSVIAASGDIDRAGIDATTRLHVVLNQARAASRA